ncbi:MAG: MgtC/SapB family protein [Xanthomonadales bacterium]|nr:MgtC/SapB family protein [Xanthomonadales bacterium]
MITPLEIALRLLLAAGLGAVIGVNRSRLEWTAGLRTHMMVAVGAALAVIVSAYGFFDVTKLPHVILDPSRIAAQVISGIGFIGAGTILFQQREQVVRGLTTAAGLWAVAAVGLAAGSGLFIAAVMATALMWIILALLKPLEKRFLVRQRKLPPTLHVSVASGQSLAEFDAVFARSGLPVNRMVLRRHHDGEETLSVRFATSVDVAKLTPLVATLRTIDGLKSVTIQPNSTDP